MIVSVSESVLYPPFLHFFQLFKKKIMYFLFFLNTWTPSCINPLCFHIYSAHLEWQANTPSTLKELFLCLSTSPFLLLRFVKPYLTQFLTCHFLNFFATRSQVLRSLSWWRGRAQSCQADPLPQSCLMLYKTWKLGSGTVCPFLSLIPSLSLLLAHTYISSPFYTVFYFNCH